MTTLGAGFGAWASTVAAAKRARIRAIASLVTILLPPLAFIDLVGAAARTLTGAPVRQHRLLHLVLDELPDVVLQLVEAWVALDHELARALDVDGHRALDSPRSGREDDHPIR